MSIKYLIVALIFLNSINVLASEKLSSDWQKEEYLSKNLLPFERKSSPVCIPLPSNFNNPASVYAVIKQQTVPSQITDCDSSQSGDEILLLVDYLPNAQHVIELYYQKNAVRSEQMDNRTMAELAVRVGGTADANGKLSGGTYVPVSNYQLPKTHFVGDKLFKYEGVGLESDKVAYRYYFDNRGALDVFGKSTNQLVLPIVGVDGSDYHQLAAWGMDVLKVGKSYGLGTPSVWTEDEPEKIQQFESASVNLNSGVNSSDFVVSYKNWQTRQKTTDLNVRYSINFGDRKVRVVAKAEHSMKNWATGLVNHDLKRIEKLDKNSEWGYIASYGKQSLAGDNLGLAVLFKTKHNPKLTSDKTNHAVTFSESTEIIEYYFLADWQSGIDGSQSESQFIEYLEYQVKKLNSPILLTKLASKS